MRTIIAGSRSIKSYDIVARAIADSGIEVTQVVSGGARGVDIIGEQWGARNGIPVRIYEANWEAHGKRAGFMRNHQMGEYADALIAVWDGKSKGTKNMIEIARKLGMVVYVVIAA